MTEPVGPFRVEVIDGTKNELFCLSVGLPAAQDAFDRAMTKRRPGEVIRLSGRYGTIQEAGGLLPIARANVASGRYRRKRRLAAARPVWTTPRGLGNKPVQAAILWP
jgi:hypothetical protein